MLSTARIGTFNKGAAVFEEGQPSDGRFGFVLCGNVQARAQDEHGPLYLNDMGRGAICGEIAVMLDHPRTSSVISTEDGTRVAFFDRQTLIAEARANVDFVESLVMATIRRIEHLRVQEEDTGLNVRWENPVELEEVIAENQRNSLELLDHLHNPRTIVLPEGRALFSQGQKPDGRIYLVQSGRVGIFRRIRGGEDGMHGERIPGDIIGYMGLVHETSPTFSARSTAPDTVVAAIDRDIFLRTLHLNPESFFWFYRMLLVSLVRFQYNIQQARN